jgi:hypothetical protein
MPLLEEEKQIISDKLYCVSWKENYTDIVNNSTNINKMNNDFARIMCAPTLTILNHTQLTYM